MFKCVPGGFLAKFCPTKRELHKLQREQELLQLAQQLIAEEGFAGLTMDRMTARSKVSKGTLYNHFSCKEDLITALSVHSLQQRYQHLCKASQFAGSSRERVLALHYAYAMFAASDATSFLCMLTATSPAIVEKSSATRIAQKQQLELGIASLCSELISAGIAQQQLTLQQGQSVEQITFVNWSLAFGLNALLHNGNISGPLSSLQAEQAILNNVNVLLDGLHWQPLSAQYDYQQSWQRIAAFMAADAEQPSSISPMES